MQLEKIYRFSNFVEALDFTNKVFHAEARLNRGKVVTAGGRVFCDTTQGDSVTSAQQHACTLTRSIHWEGVYFRTDIAYRAIARETGD